MLTMARMMEIITEKDDAKRKEMIAALEETEREKLYAEAEKLAAQGKKLADDGKKLAEEGKKIVEKYKEK